MTGGPNVAVIVGVRFEYFKVDAHHTPARAWVPRPVARRLGERQSSAGRLPHVGPGQGFTGYA
jgi:hypothetical protein